MGSLSIVENISMFFSFSMQFVLNPINLILMMDR